MRIINKEQLTAHGNREGRKIVAELLDAGLDALDPYVRVKQLVHVENGKIVLHTDGFEMKGDPHAGPLEFDLNDYDRVYVIGAAQPNSGLVIWPISLTPSISATFSWSAMGTVNNNS